MARFIPTNAAAFLRFAKGVLAITNDRMGYNVAGPSGSADDSAVKKQASVKETRRPGADSWTHVPEAAYFELRDQVNNFESVMDTTPVDSNRSQIERRNNAQRQCEAFLRYFIRFYIRHPAVKNEDLLAMHIPPIDNIRTAHTVVDEMVTFEIRRRRENELMIHFQQRGHASKAKPTGYDGAVIIWGFSENEPKTLDEYTGHTLASRTPYAMKFDTHDSGKRVWMRLCWQNARGILGDYCEAESAVVP